MVKPKNKATNKKMEKASSETEMTNNTSELCSQVGPKDCDTNSNHSSVVNGSVQSSCNIRYKN